MNVINKRLYLKDYHVKVSSATRLFRSIYLKLHFIKLVSFVQNQYTYLTSNMFMLEKTVLTV